MATLEEGQEYGLASSDLSGGNISVIHCKLTDSSLKALEDYYKIKNVGDHKTTIHFKSNQGILSIPKFESGECSRLNYKFSLSALPSGNGTFDCVQQTSGHGFSSLQSLGSLEHKVAVHATDDVFDSTRAKVNLAEEESKKVCTKEIKHSGQNISKKIKKHISSSAAMKLLSTSSNKPTHLVNPLPVHGSGSGQRHHNSTPVSNVNSSSSLSSLSSSSSWKSQSNPLSSSIASNPSQRVTTNPTPISLGHSRHSPSLSGAKNGLQQGVLTSSSTPTSKPTSGAINMPYRDRVIHLLALKPYKKPELVLRLQRDGIREKDRNSLGSVLQQVATLNKDNSYVLAKSAWIDVRQDWPFYSDGDKALLKKNLQLETRSIVTSPAVSPASSNPESPGSSQKRVAEEMEEPVAAAPNNKKKRISHMDRQKTEERQVGTVNPIIAKKPSPDPNVENQDDMEDGTDLVDYTRNFVTIKDKPMRQKYKAEFNKEYSEYRNLHDQVEQVSLRFRELFSKIDETEEGSDDFEVLKKQALKEFETQKSDPKFMAKKRRMEHLHRKLGHIKRLIHDFDLQASGNS